MDCVNESFVISELLAKLVELKIIFFAKLAKLHRSVDGARNNGIALSLQDIQAPDRARVDCQTLQEVKIRVSHLAIAAVIQTRHFFICSRN